MMMMKILHRPRSIVRDLWAGEGETQLS